MHKNHEARYKAADIIRGRIKGSKVDAFETLEDFPADAAEHRYIKAVAILTGELDFGCGNFHDGLCNADRARNGIPTYGGSEAPKGVGCCGNCARNIGYLYGIAVGTARYYAERFHKKLGFWRPGKGCILVRERRSKTCLTYCCDSYMPEPDRQRLYQISEASQEEQQAMVVAMAMLEAST